MATATTRLADIIEPAVYLDYMQLFDTEKNAFVRSGIMAAAPDEIQSQMDAGGSVIDMPHWNDLTRGYPLIMSDDPAEEAEADKLSTVGDRAIKHYWVKPWSNMDLSGLVATGDRNDPVKVVTERMAEWWIGAEQRALIDATIGVMADNVANDSADMSYPVYDDVASPSASNKVSSAAINQARFTAGDSMEDFVAMALHSKVYTDMLDLEMIDFIPESQGPWGLGTYQGRMLIVDDQMPVSTGYTNTPQYTTYLFGRGAFARAYGALDPMYAFEKDRKPERGNGGGQTIIYTRKHALMHPRGVKFTSNSVAGKSPSEAELKLATNWDRVVDRKLVRIAQLLTN